MKAALFVCARYRMKVAMTISNAIRAKPNCRYSCVWHSLYIAYISIVHTT